MAKLNASEIAKELDNHSMRRDEALWRLRLKDKTLFENNDELVEFIEKCLKDITDITDNVQDKTNKHNKELLETIKNLIRRVDHCVNLMSIKYNDKKKTISGYERNLNKKSDIITEHKFREKIVREELHKIIKIQIKERLSESYNDGFHSAQDYGEDNDY